MVRASRMPSHHFVFPSIITAVFAFRRIRHLTSGSKANVTSDTPIGSIIMRAKTTWIGSAVAPIEPRPHKLYKFEFIFQNFRRSKARRVKTMKIALSFRSGKSFARDLGTKLSSAQQKFIDEDLVFSGISVFGRSVAGMREQTKTAFYRSHRFIE